jgi:hypothetical protein
VVMACSVAYGEVPCFMRSVGGIRCGVSALLSTQSPV